MRINPDACVACMECVDFCSVEAIKKNAATGTVFVDEDACVECGVCRRADVCPADALWQPELKWPRRIRAEFSDPLRPHSGSGEAGRGTEEVKTNDVTGRYSKGRVGIALELGRPGVGTSLKDMEKVAMAVAAMGAVFVEKNPVYHLMADTKIGTFKEDVLNERILSAIIEFSTTPSNVPPMLRTLLEVSQKINTVFSVNMCSLLEEDGSCAAEEAVRNAGFKIRPNGKNNIGLGRPLAKM
jgi:NAD-dependent dihydropyrimidine dehydrogenase PreA subunit